MWLHRENLYEWYYVGIWADMIENKELLSVIKKNCGNNSDLNQIFLPFNKYNSPVELISENLRIRNKVNYYSCHNNPGEVKTITDSIESQVKNLQTRVYYIFDNENGLFHVIKE